MHITLLGLLLITSILTFGQQRELDSLYQNLQKHSQEDTIRLNLLFDICYREGHSNPEKSKTLAQEAMRISKKLDYTKGEGKSNRYLAAYYKGIGDYGKATAFAYAMLRAFEKVVNPKGIGQANQLLGIIHEEQHDYEKAKLFYLKGLSIYTKNNLKMDIGYVYNSLGSLHMTMLSYDSALAYFLKSLEVRQEIKDEKGLSQIYGNIAAAYTNLKNYPLALYYFEKGLPIIKNLNRTDYLAIQYNNMGKLYTVMGNFEKANHYLQLSLKLAITLGDKRILQDTYHKLADLEKKKGRYENALNYYELAVAYRDSVFTQDKIKQVANAEARYQTEKKDKQIQLLEYEKRIHLIWKNILLVSLILVSVLSILVYFLQRYRENKNRKILNLQIDYLTAQNKELVAKPRSLLPLGNTDEGIESSDQALLKKVIAVVESNIGDTLFGVDQMAHEIGMSRTSMQRKIKSITGFPPSELIRNIRLRKAAMLLKNKSDTVSQVSLLVGFDDPSYFTKSFKKQFGMPPSEYIKFYSQAN